MDGVTIELDRERTLRFTNSVMKEAEMIALKETGQSIVSLLQAKAMFYVVPLLMWAGLRKEDSSLSRIKVERLIEGKLSECEGPLGEALEASGFFGKEGNG